MSDRPEVLVLGAGVIGAAVAYELSQRQCRVTVVGRELAPAAPTASWASAGGLKFQRVEAETSALTRRAAQRWPRLPQELGADLGLRLWGSLEVAGSERELPQLQDQVESDRGRGAAVELVQAAEFAALGAPLAATVPAAGFNPQGGQASPRLTTAALLAAARRLGAVAIRAEAQGLLAREGRVAGAELQGRRLEADLTVLSAGSWSLGLARSAGLELALRPAGAHMLLSPPRPPSLYPTVSALGRLLSIKQLPPGGELLVGGGWPATVAPDGLGCEAEPASVERNRGNALAVCPWLSQVELPLAWCGIDAETPDHLPLLGPAPGVAGLYLATGFSLGGFQLAPAVGELAAEEIVGRPRAELEGLRPQRFAGLDGNQLGAFQRSQRPVPES